MEKKMLFSSLFILTLLISPCIVTSSATNNTSSEKISLKDEAGILFPFWFICHVNTSGYGKAVHSGNDMFIAIEYDQDGFYGNTTLKSFLHQSNINQSHKIQIFFFIGDSVLPPSGVVGQCSLKGMALMAYVW